jgi:hypothetical protein
VRRLTRPLLVLVAIVFLIEAWLWRHLEPIVEWIVAKLPFRRVKAALRAGLEWLPPPLALVVFVVPGVLLFPLKLLSLWLIAHKHWLAASLVFGFAKLVGLGVTAFILEVTKPKLLQMAWFRWLYENVLIWLAWAHALVDPIKARLRRMFYLLAPRHRGRALRLLWRIRRRMNATKRAAAAVSAGAGRAARTGQTP